jgi:hypothetical protein
VFLGRPLRAPQVRRVDRTSKSKVAHFIHLGHRDQVEPPLTDWLQEAYELSDVLASQPGTSRARSKPTAGTTTKTAKVLRKARARKPAARKTARRTPRRSAKK